MKQFHFFCLSCLALVLLMSCNPPGTGNTDPLPALYSKSIVIPDIIYLSVDSADLLLDAYIPARNLGEEPWVEFSNERKPVLLYIHGGGWQSLNRSVRNLNFMPYIDKGFAVINIDYRLLDQAPFPACIADCRYALNWIYEHAATYMLDTSRIVVSGESAGGHLALMTGLLQADTAFQIPGKPVSHRLKAAAIVNWFGISDMKEIADYWNSPHFLQKLTGDTLRKEKIFKECSPVNYITPHSSPTFTIHGDQDKTVPISHALVLHEKLDINKVSNELMIIRGKKHGDFDEREMQEIFSSIWSFLEKNAIIKAPGTR